MTRYKGDFPSLGGSLRSHHLGFKATRDNKQLLFFNAVLPASAVR